jgi:hypothetical protein
MDGVRLVGGIDPWVIMFAVTTFLHRRIGMIIFASWGIIVHFWVKRTIARLLNGVFVMGRGITTGNWIVPIGRP